MQTYFHHIADALQAALQGREVYTAGFSAEDSDFVRFNKSAVRQAGHVRQRGLGLDLIEGARHASGSLTLSGVLEDDAPRVQRLMRELRQQRAFLPEDPHLLYETKVHHTEHQGTSRLPDGAEAVSQIQEAGRGRDLVGIYAAGAIHAGFANSLGQRNWYTTYSFNFGWSFYHGGDKAVKNGYAGFVWEPTDFRRKVDWALQQLDVIKHPPRTIAPGRYRVYLAPVALYDLVGMLNWGGFGLKAHRTKQTPLLKMIEGEATLSPTITLRENTGMGIAPNFQGSGFIKPDQITLIDKGQYRDCLVSPRSAKEYQVPTNGASGNEAAESLELAEGDLPQAEILKRLGTGIFINNVWYLNYSDRTACRTTGMTRFATFWVEGGKIVAPLNVMRFDETIYRVLGANLVGLTREREFLPDADTYMARATSSGRVPGALVEDFTLTL